MAKKYRYWTEEETSLLRELYPQMWVKDLVKYFPHRNKDTLVAKALTLGLPSAKTWQHKERGLLRHHFSTASEAELRRLFPERSWAAILAQGERCGLRRKRDHPRKSVDETYFEKWSPNMAYLLGYILADGCIIKGTYKGYSGALKFGVQKSDIDILQKIKQELKSEHSISFYKNAAHFCITSQKIVSDLKKLSIAHRKSLREKIPNVPHKYIRDFIRGVIDGDGGISINAEGYPTLRLYGGNATINFVRNHFLSRLRTYSSISRLTKSKTGKHYLFYIAYRGNPAKTIIKYLYQEASLYLDRKFLLANRCINSPIARRKDYTQEETRLIKRFYRKHSKAGMLSLLANRSWSSIQHQARMLGLYIYKNK